MPEMDAQRLSIGMINTEEIFYTNRGHNQEGIDNEKPPSQYLGVDGSNYMTMATEQWC